MEQQMQLSLDFQSVTVQPGEHLAYSEVASYSADVSALRSNVVQFRSDRVLATSHFRPAVTVESDTDLINQIVSSVRFY